MTASKAWFPYMEPDPVNMEGSLWPEKKPGIYWGQGTPDGDLAGVFIAANKSTIYAQTDATDDHSPLWVKVDEGGDDADWVQLLTTAQTFSIADGAGVNFTGASTSGASGWVSTMFASMSNPADSGVTGYYSVLELELTNACVTSCAYAPLVLNILENAQASLDYSCFIHFRDYGTYEPTLFFWIGDATIATTDGDKMVSTGVEKDATHYIGIRVGTTKMWLLATTTTPAGS